MNKYKLFSMVLVPIIFALSALAYMSYVHSQNANQLHHGITNIGHELIEQRDAVINQYAEERYKVAIGRQLVNLELEFETLAETFTELPWFEVSDTQTLVGQFIESFGQQLHAATEQLDLLIGVQIANRNALHSIHTLYRAQYQHQHQVADLEVDYFEFLDDLLKQNFTANDPSIERFWAKVTDSEHKIELMTEQVLDHHFIEFVEHSEHELLDLAQKETLMTWAYLLGAIMATIAVFFLQILQRVRTLKSLNDDLMHTTEKAERAVKAKAQFLATMSHELRTPMNGVLGISQVIASETRETNTQNNVQVILDSGQHLMTILNDILDFSKLEEHKMTFEKLPFRIDQIISPVISAAKPLADEKNIKLIVNNSVSEDVEFMGDCSRIRQIIFNLVGNAIKFTSEGHVTVNVQLNKMSNKLAVAVKDTGIGIPPAMQEKVFHSFEQADLSTTRKFGGTGLGLAIVKKLTEQMKGSVRLQSVEGIGSEFIIALPLAWQNKPKAVGKASTKEHEHEHEHKRALKILLAEDNKVNAIVAKKFCEKMGHSIELAENGLAAIEKLKQHSYDLILMDNHMPEMNGVTATRHIREQLGIKTLLFAYTADVFREAHDGFIDAGADHVLTKPLQKESFIDALELFASRLEPSQPSVVPAELPSNVVALQRNPIEKLRLTEEELTNSAMLDELKGDHESFAELLQTVIADFEQAVDAIIEQFMEGDLHALETTLHTTKGMALNLGLETLSGQAAELEQWVRSQQEPAPELMQKLVNRLSVNIHQGQRLLHQAQSNRATRQQELDSAAQ